MSGLDANLQQGPPRHGHRQWGPRESGHHHHRHHRCGKPSSDIFVDATAEAYTLFIDTPGIAPADLSVVIERNVLVVTGVRKRPHRPAPEGRGGDGTNTLRREWELPDDAFVDGTVARLQNGELTVTVPRRPQAVRQYQVPIIFEDGSSASAGEGPSASGAPPPQGGAARPAPPPTHTPPPSRAGGPSGAATPPRNPWAGRGPCHSFVRDCDTFARAAMEAANTAMAFAQATAAGAAPAAAAAASTATPRSTEHSNEVHVDIDLSGAEWRNPNLPRADWQAKVVDPIIAAVAAARAANPTVYEPQEANGTESGKPEPKGAEGSKPEANGAEGGSKSVASGSDAGSVVEVKEVPSAAAATPAASDKAEGSVAEQPASAPAAAAPSHTPKGSVTPQRASSEDGSWVEAE